VTEPASISPGLGGDARIAITTEEQSKMHIAILGAGNVGGALGTGWARASHTITYGVPDPASPKYRAPSKAAGRAPARTVGQAVSDADVIVLAVPFDAVPKAISACGDIAGKIVIDATNPLRMGPSGLELSLGFSDSGAERVAAVARGAAVFKTLNQIGFEFMADNAGFTARPVMFVAGDDSARKPIVLGLVNDLGFEAVDAGSLIAARLLEPFGMLWIHMALNQKVGRDRAFVWLKRGDAGN
jgi:predicted dinucleotide-binding enzyme